MTLIPEDLGELDIEPLWTLRFGEFVPLLRGLPKPVGHLGFWSTHVFAYPDQDA